MSLGDPILAFFMTTTVGSSTKIYDRNDYNSTIRMRTISLHTLIYYLYQVYPSSGSLDYLCCIYVSVIPNYHGLIVSGRCAATGKLEVLMGRH